VLPREDAQSYQYQASRQERISGGEDTKKWARIAGDEVGLPVTPSCRPTPATSFHAPEVQRLVKLGGRGEARGSGRRCGMKEDAGGEASLQAARCYARDKPRRGSAMPEGAATAKKYTRTRVNQAACQRRKRARRAAARAARQCWRSARPALLPRRGSETCRGTT